MAYTGVTLPLTGAGDATAAPAVDLIGGFAYQAMKLVDGLEGSTEPVRAKGTTPGATDHGLITRPIGSTAFLQGISGTVTVGNPTTAVNVANPTTAVTVTNPSTSVSLSSQHTVTVGNPTTAVNVANPTTAVTVSSGLVLGGSTASIGVVSATGTTSVNVANPTTAVNVANQPTVDLSSVGSTRVIGTVNNTSGQVLGASTAAIGLISSGAQTIGTVNLSSEGSTRTAGVFSQGSPAASSADAWWVRTVTTGSAGGSTSVDLASGGSTKEVGIVAQGAAGSSATPWWVISSAVGGPGSSAVDANLTSLGSTKLVGIVDLATSTGVKGAVSLTSAGTTATLGQFAMSNPATAVTVSSGVILGAGSTANALGSVALLAGSTANSIGSVALLAGSTANTIGSVGQGNGSSGSSWVWGPVPFSSGNVVRTSVATTVDVQIVAADTTRKAMTIGNRSTVQTVGIGFSTSVLTTALANVDIFLPPSQSITFGMPGGLPLYRGPLRGINLTSTSVAGSVSVVQFG